MVFQETEKLHAVQLLQQVMMELESVLILKLLLRLAEAEEEA